ncbi:MULTISPECIES: NAD(P)/FAD-dependent oxidoreductase [Pelosinus]|uniref:Pyridine nucleotide-disulfide oxidoreductase, FAD/NAD(P)-binding domain-containing protein n=1 Tax=Pelosinus fermentans B4 TaxID=1149862 RepID=I8RAC7_9FIRM|nr:MULTISPECIES: NAD(P)/FAD-dependent oxidoreductase [Pelosinus]EIW15823.1 Pyridine nucleotide-disulfide oxidoreductase, FAD/NAD(P)-binding domain-containing protein [Pelosinus fermentans B4]EIW27471.1 FAD-dependent pyridine nucleotide-disulfide oxidoreductase [Pelosinus fermentans A11]OAM92571.1 Thioredoxin-disulfide reductase [Pelosinus fermentans DSM 17108]SDQ49354.1 thioredoxin reductase (NADPH) [Pelosinus fermentans]
MSNEIFDIGIIGGGPAGLSAALTGRIRNKSVALFEHMDFSLKLQKAHIVDNYLGVPQVTGQGMMQQFLAHCTAHNPSIIKEKVVNVFPGDDFFTLLTPGATYQARTVIIATGVVATTLFRGEKEFLGKGVSYCATCDGMMYKGKDVAVISYTSEGEHEAEYLSELCRSVYYLPQYKDMAPLRSGIKVIHEKPQTISGDVVVEKLQMGKEELNVHGVFIIRMSDPVENVLPGLALDGEVIKVNRDMSTSIPGVFAAGDCTGKPWQIAKATGEGLVAVLSAITYLGKKDK